MHNVTPWERNTPSHHLPGKETGLTAAEI